MAESKKGFPAGFYNSGPDKLLEGWIDALLLVSPAYAGKRWMRNYMYEDAIWDPKWQAT